MSKMRLYQDKDWLYRKYVDEKLSTPEIGKMCGVSNQPIRCWLNKYKIKTRDRIECQKEKIRKKVSTDPLYWDRNWLYQKYIIEKLDSTKIAEICKTTCLRICKYLKRYGIKIRSREERKHPDEIKKKIGEKSRKWCQEHPGSFGGKKGSIPWNKGMKGIYIIEKLRRKRPNIIGENHPHWKGGTTSKNDKIRHSRLYQEWRTAIFERDDYICQKCYARNGNGKAVFLNAHHILSFAEYPELRFDVDNGETLCKMCHRNVI